jgi:hypothetical protein
MNYNTAIKTRKKLENKYTNLCIEYGNTLPRSATGQTISLSPTAAWYRGTIPNTQHHDYDEFTKDKNQYKLACDIIRQNEDNKRNKLEQQINKLFVSITTEPECCNYYTHQINKIVVNDELFEYYVESSAKELQINRLKNLLAQWRHLSKDVHHKLTKRQIRLSNKFKRGE